MDNCLNCGRLIPDAGTAYGYAGPVCQCTPEPMIQRPASKYRRHHEQFGKCTPEEIEETSLRNANECNRKCLSELAKAYQGIEQLTKKLLEAQAELAAAKEENGRLVLQVAVAILNLSTRGSEWAAKGILVDAIARFPKPVGAEEEKV